VADKEVFTSGDKIMVSVNFKNSANKSAAEIAATTKPSVTIDIMSSPYQVIEASPEPIVDVYSEDEIEKAPTMLSLAKEKTALEKKLSNNDKNNEIVGNDNFSITVIEEADNNVEHIESHKGPCTPPQNNHESLDLAKGPQTPEDPMDDYDPCSPTESPDIEIDDDDILLHSGSSSSASNHGDLMKTAANTVPFLMEKSLIQGLENNDKNVSSTTNNDVSANDFNDHPIDMDMDSPFSPNDSDISDMFEPPSIFDKLTPGNKKGRKANGNVSSSTRMHSKIGKRGRKGFGMANDNKHVKMKIVDDKLKIIDDVPTSAVEMAVKEKFLRKVQRQERIVEEIKLLLKPHYNRKRINKEDYKEILRKCVPKVCHSKKGDINPTKIQKLVKGYVRKYKHARKPRNMAQT